MRIIKKIKILLLMLLILCTGTFALARVEIEKGDILQIHVRDQNGADLLLTSLQENYDPVKDPHEFVVSSEGRVYVPNIGVLDVVWRTPFEVERLIKEKIGNYVPLREVAVMLVTPKYNRIYVLGEVESPGLYKVNENKPYESRLINLLNMAGGCTDRANRSDITIIEEDGDRYKVDMRKMVKEKAVTYNVLLDDKDTIMVGQGLSRVYVVGEVSEPGGYPYIQGASFADYIAEAGGMLSSAAGGNIGIVKKKSDDKTKIYKVHIDGNFSYNGDKKVDITPGDIVYVPRSFFADWKDIGSVLGIARDSIYVFDTLQQYE